MGNPLSLIPTKNDILYLRNPRLIYVSGKRIKLIMYLFSDLVSLYCEHIDLDCADKRKETIGKECPRVITKAKTYT